MSNWLTSGRLALLAALHADPVLSAGIRVWYDWGPGLLQRYELKPVNCPLLSLVPAELTEDELANVMDAFPQDLELGIATDGPDAAPCEELTAAALDVLLAAKDTCLGLAADGLTKIELVRAQWAAHKDEESARVLWTARMTVRIHWTRWN